jgi:hypothetical protein
MARASAPVEGALRAAVAFGCTGAFSLGEYWAPTGGPGAAGDVELVAFVAADRGMQVDVPDRATGAAVSRTVDLQLAREFSPQHSLSVSLAKEALRTRRAAFVYGEHAADEVIRRLPIPAPATAIAMPVTDGGAVAGVMVFYSAAHEEVS